VISTNYAYQRQGGVKPSPEVLEKLSKIEPSSWVERGQYLNSLPKDEFTKAENYLDRQYFDTLPLHKKVGVMVKNVGQWFKAQLPKKEEKAGNDIIAMSWDEAGH
jgi:hypothetical protein